MLGFHVGSPSDGLSPQARDMPITPKKRADRGPFSRKKFLIALYQERISYLVGMIGFEPMVFCSQSRRDNQASLHPEANIFCVFARAEASKRNQVFILVALAFSFLRESSCRCPFSPLPSRRLRPHLQVRCHREDLGGDIPRAGSVSSARR